MPSVCVSFWMTYVAADRSGSAPGIYMSLIWSFGVICIYINTLTMDTFGWGTAAMVVRSKTESDLGYTVEKLPAPPL